MKVEGPSTNKNVLVDGPSAYSMVRVEGAMEVVPLPLRAYW